MCLFLEENKRTVKIAKDDIVCYKVMLRIIYSDGTVVFATPFQDDIVEKEILQGEKPYVAKVPGVGDDRVDISTDEFPLIYSYRHGGWGNSIGRGAIHTFTSQKSAKSQAAWFRFITSTSKGDTARAYVIFKCIIPKGTQYFQGKCDCERNSFASRQIIFKEILN